VDWWSIDVETRTDGTGTVDEAATARFADLVQPYSGSVAAGSEPPRWSATISLEAASPAEAIAEAMRLVINLAADAGLPGWPVVRAAVAREDVLEDDPEIQA
jgi:hypothetical protein